MAMDDSSYGKHKARTYAWISRASKLLLFTDERCKYTSYNPDMQKLKKPRSHNAYPRGFLSPRCKCKDKFSFAKFFNQPNDRDGNHRAE